MGTALYSSVRILFEEIFLDCVFEYLKEITFLEDYNSVIIFVVNSTHFTWFLSIQDVPVLVRVFLIYFL